jgi:NAD(P)-dependent dehydrogenase (short-subunit alcohol dehydrogenase family)
VADASTVALVTGGGRGIGRAIALGLAEHGLAVAVLGRSPDPLAETVDACRRAGVDALAVTADVRDVASLARAVGQASERLGVVDLLINNAGLSDTDDTGFAEADLDDMLTVVDVNLMGPMRVSHAVLPGMRAAGHGRILNVNSGMAYRRAAAYTAYGVSKAGLGRFTDLLAYQLADEGIVVLDVSPGLVRTDMTESMGMWAQMDDPPWGDPADIVAVALRLADGGLDPLSGRFVHAPTDDLDALLGVLPGDRDARTFGLRTYGPHDPLG